MLFGSKDSRKCVLLVLRRGTTLHKKISSAVPSKAPISNHDIASRLRQNSLSLSTNFFVAALRRRTTIAVIAGSPRLFLRQHRKLLVAKASAVMMQNCVGAGLTVRIKSSTNISHICAASPLCICCAMALTNIKRAKHGPVWEHFELGAVQLP